MRRLIIHPLTVVLALALASAARAGAAPATLAETGLYADFATRTLDPAVVAFEPRFPLWTDGLLKRRWIRLPEGTTIDASVPGRWEFPLGTRLWKEFALPERPVETRYLELGADGWTFATYVWSADGTAATLAPLRGVRGVAEIAPGVRHDVPGRYDCAACHQGQVQSVLGFSAVQLATAMTAEGGPDLAELVRRGLLTGVPSWQLAPSTSTLSERAQAAVGYLHGNCGHCHNPEGPLAKLGMHLRLEAGGDDAVPPAIRTTVGQAAVTHARAASAPTRIAAGEPERSQLLQRLSTRDPLAQMPPLGTHLVDPRAVELLTAWIENDLATPGSGTVTASR